MPKKEEVVEVEDNDNTEITKKDWIKIIEKDFEQDNTASFHIISKIGSALVILGILIWFTITNILPNEKDINSISVVKYFILNFILFFCLFAFISGVFLYIINKRRLDSNLPILKKDLKNINLKLIIGSLIILLILIGINFYEQNITQNYSFYFILSVIISIISGLIYWILYLLFRGFVPYGVLLFKLRYDILLNKVDNIEEIKKRYIDIYGPPPEIVIKDKNGKIKPY